MLESWEIEGIGDAALRSAGLDPTELPDPIRLARRLVGSVRRLPASGLPGDAVLVRVGAERRIYVRGKLTPERLRWAVLHECAEAVLADEDYREPDIESVADRLAACLGAPHKAALCVIRARGAKWRQLALDFGSTQSCAALRYGEVTGEPIALLTPASIRYRGDESFVWPPENELRKWRGPRVTKIRDDHGRAVARAS